MWFSRILVPLDGRPPAERAIETARILAEAADGELLLAMVRETGAPEADELRYLEHRARDVADRVQVETALLTGEVSQTLAEFARARGVDLVVITAHPRGGLSRLRFPSVSDALLRQLETPQLRIPGALASPAGFAQMLVTIDGSPASELIVEPAAALAGLLGVHVTILRVLTDPVPSREVRLEARENLDRVAGNLRLRGIACRTALEHGSDPAFAILAYARAIQADVIAMAGHGAGGTAGPLAGSVVEAVTARAERPLLLLQPLGSAVSAVRRRNSAPVATEEAIQ